MTAHALTPNPSPKERGEQFPHFRANLQRTGVIDTPFAPPLALAWEHTLDDEVRSPTIANGCIYVASLNSHAYCFNLSGELQWQFKAGSRINASLMLVQDRAYFGCNDSMFYCLNAHTGDLIWNQRAKMAIQGNFAVSDDVVFCGSYDGHVYAFDAHNGVPRWKVNVGSGVNASLALMDDALYFGTNGGTLHALDARTGETLWQVACARRHQLNLCGDGARPVCGHTRRALVRLRCAHGFIALVARLRRKNLRLALCR